MKKQIVFTSAMGQQVYQYTEGKTYVASPGDAPKGTALKRGPRGGYYYEEPGKKEPTKAGLFKDPTAQKIYSKALKDGDPPKVAFDKALAFTQEDSEEPNYGWDEQPEDMKKMGPDEAKKKYLEPAMITPKPRPPSIDRDMEFEEPYLDEEEAPEDEEQGITEPNTVEQGTKEEPESWQPALEDIFDNDDKNDMLYDMQAIIQEDKESGKSPQEIVNHLYDDSSMGKFLNDEYDGNEYDLRLNVEDNDFTAADFKNAVRQGTKEEPEITKLPSPNLGARVAHPKFGEGEVVSFVSNPNHPEYGKTVVQFGEEKKYVDDNEFTDVKPATYGKPMGKGPYKKISY